MLRTALCILFASALVGCASTGGVGDEVIAGNVDVQKVAAIDSAARRAGVTVIWMRMPTKPAGS